MSIKPQKVVVAGRQLTPVELIGYWRNVAASGYREPIPYVLRMCAADLEGALLAIEDPAAYAALDADCLPPPPERTADVD